MVLPANEEPGCCCPRALEYVKTKGQRKLDSGSP